MVLSATLANAADERQARVNAMAGSATYSSQGGAFVPLSVATKLRQGDAIKTGPGSHVDVDLGGNVGIVQVAPRSTLVLEKLSISETGPEHLTETELRVDSGAIYAKINKLARGSRYEIATPKGIAGIRGTAVYVSADGRVTVLDGVAAVAYTNATGGVDTYIVKSGETVAPDDRPPHPATPEQLREIVEALRDAAAHGVGVATPSFAGRLEFDQTFISPVLPVKTEAPAEEPFPGDTIKSK